MNPADDAARALRGAFARWTRRGEPKLDHQEDTMTDDNNTVATPDVHNTSEHSMPNEETGQHENAEAHEPSAHAAAPTVADLEQVTGERDALKDRLARLQAEFDNFRKRETNARTDARASATQDAIEPFLSVMDNFALALKSDGSAEQLRSGVQLILKQMDEALRTLNVQPVETVGTQFDPHVHEALGSVESAEHPDHQVIEEIRRGYKLRDKLLRPALVRIAVNPHQVSE